MKGREWTLERMPDGRVEIALWHRAPITGTTNRWNSAAVITLPANDFARTVLAEAALARELAVHNAMERSSWDMKLSWTGRGPPLALRALRRGLLLLFGNTWGSGFLAGLTAALLGFAFGRHG